MGLFEQLKGDFHFYRKVNPHQGFLGVLFDRYFWVCANYRIGHWACTASGGVLPRTARPFYLCVNLFVSALTGTDIRSGAVIGRRFHVHTSFGIMIADGVVIGDDCTIFTGVCLVNKSNNRGEGQPRIGNRVTLGVGSKIVGGVTVADDVIVGANAVVLHDVPAGHMAVGVPAQVKPRITTQDQGATGPVGNDAELLRGLSHSGF